MRAKAAALVLALGILAVGASCTTSVGFADRASASPAASERPAHQKVKVIARIYPDLHARAVREGLTWHHLRLMARHRWNATHPAWVRAERMRYLIANPTPSGNRELAQLYLPAEEFRCMDSIVGVESSWNHLVYNRAGSGAYGIPQALPGSKMASAGADWATNPLTQIRWMRGYANGRYGGLCAAAGARFAQGWY